MITMPVLNYLLCGQAVLIDAVAFLFFFLFFAVCIVCNATHGDDLPHPVALLDQNQRTDHETKQNTRKERSCEKAPVIPREVLSLDFLSPRDEITT